MLDPARESIEPVGPSEPLHERYALRFHGSGTSFFLIFLKNVLLTLLTAGVYLAWAKTERRRYVWQNLEFHGQHLRYSGTGLELFKGYCVVLLGYLGFFALPYLAGRVSAQLKTALEMTLLIGIVLAMPSLIYRSRAYLYSRTSWRGIRFGLLRASGRYSREFLVGLLLAIATLGLYLPVMTNRLHRVLVDNTRFGTLEFSYTGKDRDALRMGVAAFFLALLTLGFYYPWYVAKLGRYRGLHTRVGPNARIDYRLTGGELLRIYLLNIWGTTLTLGLAFPWILMYSVRYAAERIGVEGWIDFESIGQREAGGGAAADGFADALDIGLGV
jgi:uncharacterized membrane protein YjgN (DUF898 family)